ncbi:hypothetical protein FCM35_KLT05572 [Carex littledalei]|uniref:Uncharacterized protein n=1 Tax=Carex littledalei TaxID=544730 RepID=A0A833QSK3_9POAL|nr:hypothetical protein FCM35_KLT05572 [Carex littledalei]
MFLVSNLLLSQGQQISQLKSKLWLSLHTPREVADNIQDIFQLGLATENEIYLGWPVDVSNRSNFEHLMDRIDTRLTQAGKNSSDMSTTLIHKSVIKMIEAKLRKKFWGTGNEKSLEIGNKRRGLLDICYVGKTLESMPPQALITKSRWKFGDSKGVIPRVKRFIIARPFDPLCPICGTEEEITLHVIFKCDRLIGPDRGAEYGNVSGEYRCWVDGSYQVPDAGGLVYILYQQAELVQYETRTEQASSPFHMEALVMCSASETRLHAYWDVMEAWLIFRCNRGYKCYYVTSCCPQIS